MKPIIKYRGGKSKEIQHFLKYMPQFSGRYVEPFFGGGALFFYLEPHNAIINDLNNKLMAFYCGIRDNFDEVKKELTGMELLYKKNHEAFEAQKRLYPKERVPDPNEPLYYKIRNMYNGLIPSKYTNTFLYYFINKTAYSGMIRFNSKGEFNVPYGRYKNFNASMVTKQHQQLLQETKIYNLDYSRIFQMLCPNDFVFLDPPYDCVFSDYGNKEYKGGFLEADHRKLAKKFRNLPCKAMLVIGKTPLTEELYGDMVIDEYAKNYAVNIKNRFHSTSNHILVVNY